ncbi:unnamed protein product [Rotaria magnacalcarata]|uniref:Uncharacterized protein n=1 Tax=Rotaria magnacalcarata TaxID=392030 RepID=A0A818ZSR3_9BILA|nr:unnamed protein product [Rotaria magnacalcarata]CAF1591519.1 unnamed protein product [Rotaria magnacalcarata]CAF1985055.1 unnamed protein product [Rotaria magnacalcarata]CAF2081114.1 unnamed protein product [Rotaria magnacalcarata]CAF2120290.1 unnamed protein product [Rotaria magnacalcarata]
MSNEADLLVPSDNASSYRLYPQRFYVLGVFSLLAFNQCLIWITFSPIARSVETYYKIDEATVDLLLNWGPIIFIPCLPLTYILLNKHNGLRRCIILLAVTDFIATALRVIPSIVTSPSSPHFSAISMPFMYAGQILNAACGPLAMAPVSQLSCLWFGPNQRTRATTVGIVAHKFGSTIAFLISPAIVTVPEHIPRLLYVHLCLAFVACVLTLVYFPAQPPTPPSHAAEFLMLRRTSEESNSSWRTSMKNVWRCMTTPSYVLLSTAGGLVGGAFGAWTSLFDVILKPENYTEQQSGWFGFGALVSCIVGLLCMGALADTHYFLRRRKILVVLSFIGCFIAVFWFELSVHTVFYEKPILHSTTVTIGLSVAVAGLFQGAVLPLIYEAIAEIMFPLPESLSASILLQWLNVTVLILLFIAPNREKLINLLVLIAHGTCIIMSCIARFTYTRRDEDEKKQYQKEDEPLLNYDSMNTCGNETIDQP